MNEKERRELEHFARDRIINHLEQAKAFLNDFDAPGMKEHFDSLISYFGRLSIPDAEKITHGKEG